MSYWVETNDFKEVNDILICYKWGGKIPHDTRMHYDIDLHYENMINKPLKHRTLIITGNFNNSDTLFKLNTFINKDRGDLTYVIFNFNIKSIDIHNSLSIKNIDFIGCFKIGWCWFDKELSISECYINSKADIIGNYFMSKIKLDIETGDNRIIFNDNKLSNLFYLPYNDKLIINNLILINNQLKPLEFNEYFKNISKEDNYLIGLRETYAYIKNYFQQRNNYISSNTFYALEMLARAKELKLFKGTIKHSVSFANKVIFVPINFSKDLQRFIFWVNAITSNHGQSIIRPVAWLIFLALVCRITECVLKIDGFYWLGVVFFPYFPNIDYKGLDTGWQIQLLLFGYLSFKSLSAMLWWQLSRAIRKDIKR